MRQYVQGAKAAAAVMLLGTLAIGLVGCSSGKVRADFAKAPDDRPLEIPPVLVASQVVDSGAVGSVALSARKPAAPQSSSSGFIVKGERDAVYGQVGTALEAVDGVQIASRAQLLGSYDVAYQGSNFLVRVVAVEAGVYVSAVDPRGQPATGGPAESLIASLKSALGG